MKFACLAVAATLAVAMAAPAEAGGKPDSVADHTDQPPLRPMG